MGRSQFFQNFLHNLRQVVSDEFFGAYSHITLDHSMDYPIHHSIPLIFLIVRMDQIIHYLVHFTHSVGSILKSILCFFLWTQTHSLLKPVLSKRLIAALFAAINPSQSASGTNFDLSLRFHRITLTYRTFLRRQPSFSPYFLSPKLTFTFISNWFALSVHSTDSFLSHLVP
jgi:hypothetical protein